MKRYLVINKETGEVTTKGLLTEIEAKEQLVFQNKSHQELYNEPSPYRIFVVAQSIAFNRHKGEPLEGFRS